MASKVIYSAVAVLGIAAAAGAAYWYQDKSTGPKEITAAGSASAPAGGASAPGGAPRGGMPSVEVAKVEASRLQDDAQAVGSLRSKQNVMLRPEVSGRVQTLGFTDGGRVRRGDVMMQLEDGLQRAEIRQAEAQMSIARANLKRNQELVAQNFVAQRVLDESGASLQVAEAQVSLACARWDRMRVVAPFDGTVGIRNVNIGDYVKDGADLVNLEDLSSMFVDFRMPERFIGKLRREQAIEMQLDAMPGRQFKAKIEAIDPQLDANGRSVLIRAVLPNTSGEPLAQRPAGGPPGAGGGGAGGAPGAGGSGGRPAVAGGAPVSAAGAKPADKPAAKPVARPPQRPASAPVAAAPRPMDPMAVSCAQFSNAAITARAASGMASTGNASAPLGAAAGGRVAGGGGGTGAGMAAGGGGRPAGAAPGAGGATSADGATRAAGAPAGGRAAGGSAGAVPGGRAGGPGAGGGAPGAGGGTPLRPGMFARVTAVFNIKEAALSVPEEAIVPQGGRQFVIRVVEQTEAQGKEIADKQAADAAKAAEAAKAAAAASSAPVSAGAAPAGGGGGAPGGAGGAQPYNMSGFVDGKRLVSQRQEVKLGIRRPGRVEITEGLAETDTVVVAGQQRLQRDNTPVRVIELGRAPGAPSGAPSGTPGGAPSGVPGGAPNAASGSPTNAASGSVGGAAPAIAAPAPAASR